MLFFSLMQKHSKGENIPIASYFIAHKKRIQMLLYMFVTNILSVKNTSNHP